MLLINNKTYFITQREMIVVENSEEFITTLLESTIETITTNHPVLFQFTGDNKIYYFIIGYNDILILTISDDEIYAESLEKDILEFTEELLGYTDKILKNYIKEPQKYRKFKALKDELSLSFTSVSNVYNCHDIRMKTINDILYSYENNYPYAIIYDQLDDFTETYRIVFEDITYLITLNVLYTTVDEYNVGLEEFTKLLYKNLVQTKNTHIKKYLKRLKKYITKSTNTN